MTIDIAMPTLISKSRFKAHALEYFRQIEASGVPVIISDHGHARLEIRPYHAPGQSPLETLHGSLLHFDQPTAPVACCGEATR